MDWENAFKKILSKKSKKNSTYQREIAAHEQKITSKKANACSNTVFSLYFKIRAKKSTLQNHSLFAPLPVSAWPKSLLQFDFKNHDNVWTDLKRQRPNTIQILWIAKKIRSAGWETEAAIKNRGFFVSFQVF